MAGWFKLVGPSIGAQRVIGALLLIAIVLGVRQLLRPWGRNVATVAAVVTSVVVYAQGSLMAVSWWYGYAAVIWGVLLVRSAGPATSPEEGDVQPTPWETVRLVAGGLLFGLALGARVDLALAVAAAGGAVKEHEDEGGELCRERAGRAAPASLRSPSDAVPRDRGGTLRPWSCELLKTVWGHHVILRMRGKRRAT